MGVFEGRNGLSKALFDDKSLPGQTLNFEISDEVARELNQLNSLGHDPNKIIIHKGSRLLEYTTHDTWLQCAKNITKSHI